MIIGFCGKARAGKDTAGDVLVKNGFRKLAFANELKHLCKKYFFLTNEELYIQKTENSRRILQGVGLLIRDEVSPNFWIDRVLNNIKNSEDIVITDVRFPNEAEAIQNRGGILIKINRFPQPIIECNPDHPSERIDLLKEDILIENEEGKIKEFQSRISNFLERRR